MRKLNGISLVIAFALASWGSLSAAPRPAVTTANVNRSSREGRELLQQIRDDTWAIQKTIGPLAVETRSGETSWTNQGNALTFAKDKVNDVARDVRTLEGLQAHLQPWERTELNRVRPMAVELTDDTTDAIQAFNHDRYRTLTSQMTSYYANMLNRARALRISVDKSVDVAKLDTELNQLNRRS